LEAGNGRQARFQALSLAAMEAVAIAGRPSLPRSNLLSPSPSLLFCFPCLCFSSGSLFSFQKNLQIFLDSPSHRIFRYMHEALNIDKK
jgi:hypothetical protein